MWAFSLFTFHGPGFDAYTVIKLKVPKEQLFDAKSSGAHFISKSEGFMHGKVQHIWFSYRHKDLGNYYIIKYYRMNSEDSKYSEEEDF